MSKIIEEIELEYEEEKNIRNYNVRNYIKVMKICEYMEAEKVNRYQNLKESEKQEVFDILKKMYSIPEYLTVQEAADFLSVTPQMARRYCAEGKIIAHQRLEGSGQWRIETKQFINHPNWDEFVQKKLELRNQSYKVAEKMSEYLDDEDV